MSDPSPPAHLYFLGYEFGSCPPTQLSVRDGVWPKDVEDSV